MSEKHIYKYPNGATLIYYQQNINKSTKATIGFKVPNVDIPNYNESIYRYKNVIFYTDSEGGIRVPLIKPGVIHLAEHMFFKNLPTMKKEDMVNIFRKTDTLYNAHTSQDAVAVDFDCPSKFVEQIFDIQSQMMLRKNFNQTELEQEKKVVYQELQRSLDLDLEEPVISYISNTTTILKNDEILGMYKDIIDSISPNELKRFCRTHFTQENLVMSIVSDLPFDKIKELCEKNFINKIPSVPNSKVQTQPRHYLFDEDCEIMLPNVAQKTASLNFWFKGSDNYEENQKFSYIEDYLMNNFSGRLMQKFRLNNQLTYTPEFETIDLPMLNLKHFVITTTPEHVNTCINLFTEVITELLENGITLDEIAGFKEMWKNHRERKTNLKNMDPGNMFYNYIYNEPVFIKNMYEKVESISKEEVDSYLKEIYTNSKLIFSVYGNFDESQIPTIAEITNQFRPYNKYATKQMINKKEVEEMYEFFQNLPTDLSEEEMEELETLYNFKVVSASQSEKDLFEAQIEQSFEENTEENLNYEQTEDNEKSKSQNDEEIVDLIIDELLKVKDRLKNVENKIADDNTDDNVDDNVENIINEDKLIN